MPSPQAVLTLVGVFIAAPVVTYFAGISEGADMAWKRAEARPPQVQIKTVPGPPQVKTVPTTPQACKDLITEYKTALKLERELLDAPPSVSVSTGQHVMELAAQLSYTEDNIKKLASACS